MWNKKHLLVGIGATMLASALVSFSNGDDNEKKKKYHIIHQKDGVLQEFDTILPMNTSYSVEDYLADMGISDEDVRIIEIPAAGEHNMVFMGSPEGGDKVIVRHIDEDMMVSDEDGTRQEVKIIKKQDENGVETIQKFVNGEEVELSDEDLEELKKHEGNHGQKRVIRIEEGSDEGTWSEKETHQDVELKVEVDEDGKMTVKKFINGEEVEVSEEELEKIQMHHEEGGHGQMIIIEEDEMGEGNEEMEFIIESMDGEIDSLLQEIEIESILEEGEGEQRIIIKEIRMDSESQSDGSDEVEKRIRVHSSVDVDGEGEDFTIVLVSENIDESGASENVVMTRQMEMNDPISVYPNPNNGMFTIEFEQKEKLKTAIEVLDIQGKVVFKEKLGNFSGHYKKELDLKKNGAGIYLVNVQQGGEVSAVKVVVE